MLTWREVRTFIRDGNPEPPKRVELSDKEWKEQLTDNQFQITRLKGTERPFSSDVCTSFEPGIYACVCCKTPLFNAKEKFESGTGWPSFTLPLKENVVGYHADNSHGMQRVEVTCNVCDAHLGHIFPDGPAPSGLRYCVNAVSLEKVEEHVK